jgi:hypothetical protein
MPCAEPVPITGTTPADVLDALAQNMERFGVCRSRHLSLTEAVRIRQDAENWTDPYPNLQYWQSAPRGPR